MPKIAQQLIEKKYLNRDALEEILNEASKTKISSNLKSDRLSSTTFVHVPEWHDNNLDLVEIIEILEEALTLKSNAGGAIKVRIREVLQKIQQSM